MEQPSPQAPRTTEDGQPQPLGQPLAADPATGDCYYGGVVLEEGQGPLKLGDFVTVGICSATVARLLPCGMPPVAQVVALWRTAGASGCWMCELRLLLRPGLQGAPAKKPFHGSAELIASAKGFLECRLADVSPHTVVVEDATAFFQREVFPETAFFVRERQCADAAARSEPLPLLPGMSLAESLLAMAPLGPRSTLVQSLAAAKLSSPPSSAAVKKRPRDDKTAAAETTTASDDVPGGGGGDDDDGDDVKLAIKKKQSLSQQQQQEQEQEQEQQPEKKRPKGIRSWIELVSTGSTRVCLFLHHLSLSPNCDLFGDLTPPFVISAAACQSIADAPA